MGDKLTRTRYEIIVAMISLNPELYDRLKIYFR